MAIFNSNARGDRDTAPGFSPAVHSAQPTGTKRGMFSVIGPDVVITGTIAATADLHIDGRVDGDVQCGNLVQGPDSRITGAVKAESARLGGSIEGAVSVRQLTVERSARITGDVDYESIAIESGASIDGRLRHAATAAVEARAAESSAPDPASAPASGQQLDDVVQFTTSPTA